MNVIKLIFYNSNLEFKIPIVLHDTRVANIWYEWFMKDDIQDYRTKKLDIGYSPHTKNIVEPKLLSEINSIVNRINEKTELNLPHVTECTTEHTNYLHELFEKYGEGKSKDDFILDKELDDLYLKLNEKIHSIEFYYKTKVSSHPLQFDDPFNTPPHVKILYAWNPRINLELEEDDWNMIIPFSADAYELCLGYNTLGKNLLHAVNDEDNEVIERNMLAPQISFSNEVTLSFNVPFSSNALYEYQKRWNKVNTMKQFGDWKRNREGLISIGRIASTWLHQNCTGFGLQTDLSVYDNFRFEK